MRLKNIFLIAISVSSVLFTQCKKDTKEEPAVTPTPATPTSSAPATITQLFAQNGVQAVAAQASMSISQTATLSGVKITIPSNAFVDATTGAAITGTVDISVKGIFTKKDIILTGAPANSAGKLIATKGCVKVNASQNSQTLRVAPGSNIVVNVPEPGTPVSNLKKFYAQQISVTDTAKVWRASSDTNSLVAVFDTTSQKYFYQARLDSVAWLNTGYEWDTTSTKTTVSIMLDTTYNATNATVYISLNGKMVVGALYSQGNGLYSINNIPIGQNVYFVVIGIKNGTYYSAFLQANISTSYSNSMTPQATTLSAIQSQLLLLP